MSFIRRRRRWTRTFDYLFRSLTTTKHCIVEPRDPAVTRTQSGATIAIEEPDLASEPCRGTVMCVHGAPGSVFDWRYLGPTLTRRQFRVIRVDCPGHGRTPRGTLRDERDGSARSVARFLTDVANELGPDVMTSRPFVVGHSLGCEAVVSLAAQSLEKQHDMFRLGGVALLCPIGYRPHRGLSNGTSRNLANFLVPALKMTGPLKNWVAKAFSVRAFGFPVRNSSEEYMWMFERAAAVEFDTNRKHLATIAGSPLPIFLAHGTSDPLMEPSIHEEILESWPGEITSDSTATTNAIAESRVVDKGNLRFVSFKKQGHYVGLKFCVESVASHIDDWLVGKSA